jgi:general secretion pathway protein A
VLLIVDEAQNLPPKTLEEIRMLSNLESEKHHLIQIILVGQPELKFKLQRKGLEQFVQRVTVHCHLEGLANDEVTQYIQHRLQVAEAQNPNLFEPEAIDMIHKYSRGIPRVINIICDTALVFGFADERQTIQPDLIETVVRERKDAGIYFHAIEEPDPQTLPGEAEDAAPQASNNQIQFLERRVRMLENMVNHIDQRLTVVTDKRDERDTTVVELIKMLKQNMESRMRLILKLLQLSQRTLLKDDASDHEEAAQRNSFFSRRKRGA